MRGIAMSIADEIRNMNNSFLATKTQEKLKEMPLEKLAEEWLSVDTGLKKDAQNADGSSIDKNKYLQSKKEIMDKLAQVLTPEIFKQKTDEYYASVLKDNYNTADLSGVSALLGDYPAPAGDVKDVVDYTKSLVVSKKECVEKPVDLNIANPNLNYTNVTIQAHKETVDSLADKKNIAGKTLTFKNQQGENIADTTFHKGGDMSISLPDENNQHRHYRITKDGNLMREEGNAGSGESQTASMRPVDPAQMSPLDKQAYTMANEAKNIWKEYADGNLDDKISKETPVTVNEGAENEGVNVNEQNNEIEVNQDTRESTKVNEFNPLVNMIDPTKINEGESPKPQPKNEGDINGDDLDQPTRRPDEVYWKEADIIDTMFGWLVDGANAATNFVVHRIEDVACGIWSQLNKSWIRQKEEKVKTANSTELMHKELSNLHNARLKRAEKSCSVKNINKLLESGNIQTILDENPAFAALYGQMPHLQKLTSPEQMADKEKRKISASAISGVITLTEAFSNKFALASMMDEKIQKKSAFNNEDRDEIYTARQKEGIGVFLKAVNENFQKNKTNAAPGKDDAVILTETMEQIIDGIKKANDHNSKAVEQGKYDEKNQTPDINVALGKFKKYLPREQTPQNRNTHQPETLRDEVSSAERDANAHNSARNQLNNEEAELNGREEDLQKRRERVKQTRDNINGTEHQSENQNSNENENAHETTQQPSRSFPNRGNSR